MKKFLLLKLMVLSVFSVLSAEISAQSFTEKTVTGLPALGQGNVAVGDINNDGKLDIVMSGQVSATGDTTRVFFGNGDGTFTESAFNNGTGTGGAINIPGMEQSSVALGDYDKDGNLDLLLTGYSRTTKKSTTKLYRNSGSPNYQFIEQTSITLLGVNQADGRFIDFNNDGWPDIIVSGSVANSTSGPSSSIAKGSNIYKNNGDGTFTAINVAAYVGSQYSCNVIADYNNDGYLDILQWGYPGLAKYIKNNGDGSSFTDVGRNGTQLPSGRNDNGICANLIDYNNDGILEPTSWAGAYTTGFTLFNVNSSTFATAAGSTLTWSPATPTALTGVSNPRSVSWADYDNDGIQDMILTSITGPTSTLYRQAPIGTFTAVADFTLPGVRWGNVIWADFNGDNKLDILITGCTNITDTYTGVSKVFLNTSTLVNAQNKAVAPTGLSSTPAGPTVALSWNKTTDNASGTTETPDLGITYNIRVGTTPGGSDIVNPGLSPNGNLKIPALGSIRAPIAGTTVPYKLKGLLPGTYYWSVQAVDYGLLGGNWSTESSFTIVDVSTIPATQAIMTATPATLSTANPTQLTLAWTNGSGYRTAVFMKTGNNPADAAAPIADTWYNANTVFGSGDQIGTSGWYCVFNSAVDPIGASNVIITGVTPAAPYQFMVLSYNAKTDKTVINYNTTTSTNNPIVITNADYVVPTTLITALTTSTNTSGVSVAITPSVSANVSYPAVVFIKQGIDGTEDVPLVNNTTYTGNSSFGAGSQVGTSGWYCVLNGSTSYKGSGAQNPFAAFSNLLPNTSYQVRACTFNGIPGFEKYSARAGVLVTPIIVTPTTQASADTATGITSTTANLTWTNGNGYQRVVFATSGVTPPPALNDGTSYPVGTMLGEWNSIYNGTGNSYAYTGLTPSTNYTFIVYEYNGTPSLEKYITTTATKNPKVFRTMVAGPVASAATEILETSFIANWGASAGATGYKLDVSAASDFSTLLSGYANQDVMNVTSYTITGLVVNTPYYYRVRAYDGIGTSDNSNVISATPIVPLLKPQTITFTLPASKVLGDAPFDITYSTTGGSGNPVTFKSSNTSVATISGITVTMVGLGSTDISANQAGNSEYADATQVTQTLTVTKVPQSIVFGTLPVKTFGDPAFTLTATGGPTGNPITFTSSNSSVATVSGNSVTIIGAGTTNITASQTGDNTYADATPVVQVLTVNKATQTIAFPALPSKTYGNAPFDLSATGGASGNAVTFSSDNTAVATISGNTVTIVGAGTANITASQATSTNYLAAKDNTQALTVNKASQTISFDALPIKTYLDAPFTINATASTGLPVTFTSGNTNIVTVSGSTVTINMPGVVTITASQAGDVNYLAATTTQNLTINKLTQTITFNALPAFKNSDPDYQLGATASSGLRVTYKSGDLSIAAIQGDITNDYLHFYGAGTTTITANQGGNDYYAAATPVVQTLTVTSTTDVPQLTDGEVLVYPNPASDKVTVSFGKTSTNATIGVYSLTGQQMSLVKTDGSQTDIDVSSFKAGIYIIKIMSTDGIIVKQIVKQ